jgi:hypothetical protein
MVTPWTLLTRSDAALILAAWAVLVGFLCGMAFCVCLFWRRITKPADDRLLRRQLDEATAQLVYLYADRDKLARELVTGIGRRKGAA